MVKSCLAMKYPPRKFHPDRARGAGPSAEKDGQDLDEQVPPAKRRWRAKRMVHFDIDPSNGKLSAYSICEELTHAS